MIVYDEDFGFCIQFSDRMTRQLKLLSEDDFQELRSRILNADEYSYINSVSRERVYVGTFGEDPREFLYAPPTPPGLPELEVIIYETISDFACEKLYDKLHNEICEFREMEKKLSASLVYDLWYRIGFFEEFYAMLSADYAETALTDAERFWLLSKPAPLLFLYETWMDCDGAMNYDWDAMSDWIRSMYQEECRLEERKQNENG